MAPYDHMASKDISDDRCTVQYILVYTRQFLDLRILRCCPRESFVLYKKICILWSKILLYLFIYINEIDESFSRTLLLWGLYTCI